MATDHRQVFPFERLPSEIRNEIYRDLLCSFKRARTPSYSERIRPADHSISTTILRTSKNIYREAYALMIRTNQFVHVASSCGVDLANMLADRKVPAVTADTGRARRFRGCVLSVSITLQELDGHDDAYRSAPFDAVILARDLGLFCRGLYRGLDALTDFREDSSTIRVRLGGPSPAAGRHVLDHNPLRGYFAGRIQEALLLPFRRELRGVAATVRIHGAVSRGIASAAKEDIARPRWGDPKAVIDEFEAADRYAHSCLDAGDPVLASTTWGEAAADIVEMRSADCWGRLAGEEGGGRPFLDELVGLYATVAFKCALSRLRGARPRISYWRPLTASCALDEFDQAMGQNYWAEGFEWKPPEASKARLLELVAACFALAGDPLKARLCGIARRLRLGMTEDMAKFLS